MINKQSKSDYPCRCFMCSKDLQKDPKQQAVSIKGFFTGTPNPKYGWMLWVCEGCAYDLIAALNLDLKKLEALRACDKENDEREAMITNNGQNENGP